MKIVDGFILKNIADTFVVVPLGTNTVSFRSIISLNETGAFLWSKLESETTKEQLTEAMLKEYDIDEATAKADIEAFVAKLTEAGLLANE